MVSSSKELPLVLAGPIVRRATVDSVWFWIVFSKEIAFVQPHIIPYNDVGQIEFSLIEGLHEIGVQSVDPIVIRLGEKIWVALCKAIPRPGKTFPTDTILGYDLDITTVDTTLNVSASTKLSDELKLNYDPFPLPTFVIGEKNTTLVHGSCRRPGSGNDIEGDHGADAFLTFDKWMSTKASEVTDRPASLFLTGDQIYADAVAVPLFTALHTVAYKVFGYVEQIPSSDPKYQDAFISVDKISWQEHPQKGWTDRKKLTHVVEKKSLKEKAVEVIHGQKAIPSTFGLEGSPSQIGFTTDDGDNHLLSFPEYASMYLVVWNPELCKNYFVDTASGPLKDYSVSVQACRRVMANCSTYMLFDDHEVTDDWNMDDTWQNITRNNNMSKRIIANALAAYWCFQAWGNDPDMFDKNFMDTIPEKQKYKWQKESFMKTVPQHLQNMWKNKGLPDAITKNYDDILLNMHWSFMAASNPKALCVDTRTSRQFDPGKPAILSGPKVWDFLQILFQRNAFQKDDVLLMVLPTPFLPHPSYLAGQGIFPYPQARYEGDYENYGNNPKQRADLIQFLKSKYGPSAIVIFSGDIHFGSVVLGKYKYSKDLSSIWSSPEWVVPVVQITSSPIKNVNSNFTNETWKAAWYKDIGNLGVHLISLNSRDTDEYPEKSRPPTYIGSEWIVGLPEGDLNKNPPRPSYIFENHFCVVEMPRLPDNHNVKSVFVGALVDKGEPFSSKITVSLDDVFAGVNMPSPPSPQPGMGAGSRAPIPD